MLYKLGYGFGCCIKDSNNKAVNMDNIEKWKKVNKNHLSIFSPKENHCFRSNVFSSMHFSMYVCVCIKCKLGNLYHLYKKIILSYNFVSQIFSKP